MKFICADVLMLFNNIYQKQIPNFSQTWETGRFLEIVLCFIQLHLRRKREYVYGGVKYIVIIRRQEGLYTNTLQRYMGLTRFLTITFNFNLYTIDYLNNIH